MDNKNFQRKLLDIANGLCLFDAYITLGGVKAFDDKLHYLQKALVKGIVGTDGYVLDADKLYNNILGQRKKVIKSYTYYGEDNVIACWDHAHWVIVDKDKRVIYDPLGLRINPYKEITSYRIVTNL